MNRSLYRFMCLTVCAIAAVNSATIESVSSGGDWSDTLTWVGYKIPKEADDVVIKGMVSVTSLSTSRNLTIEPGATLQNGGSLGWVTLEVKGDLVNNGTIRNNPTVNELWIDSYGDIVNNGTWQPAKTFIASARAQSIRQSAGTEFSGLLRKTNVNGFGDTFPLVAASDLIINATEFSAMGYTDKYFWGVVDMAGHNLTLRGATSLVNAVLKNTATLSGLDSSVVSSCSVEGAITLAGQITLINGNVTFNGDVTVADTLQNGGALGWLTPKFKAKLVNNGTIRNNPKGNEIWLDLYGDVVNNGKWAPAKTFFASERRQAVSQSSGTEFTGNLFKTNGSGYADTFPAVALSDLVINAASLNGNGYKDSNYFRGVFDMDGHVLTIRGGTSLVNVLLKNCGSLIGRDSSSVGSCAFEGAVSLGGCVTLTDGNVAFGGDVTVVDTLQNGGGLGWLTPKFRAKLTNNGTVRNNPKGNELWIDCYGDMVNNGVWTPAKTCIASERRQVISQAAATQFGGRLQKTSAAGTGDTFALVASSDIVVAAAEFNMMGYTTRYFRGMVDMAGFNLTLRGPTVLTSGIMTRVDTLFCKDSAVLRSLTIDGPVCLADTVTIGDGSVTFGGECTVNGILQNGGASGWLTLSANGGIVNYGSIRNNPTGNALWIAIRGNITNDGAWTNSQNTLVDTVDQTINLAGDKAITAPVMFDALWAGGPYQWQKNSEDLAAASKTLDFEMVSVAAAGVYQCKHGDSLSRTITVKNGSGSGISRHPAMLQGGETIRFGWGILQQGSFVLRLSTPERRTYKLRVFDLCGRQQTLLQGEVGRGIHSLALVRPVTGTYVVCFESGSFRETRRVMIRR